MERAAAVTALEWAVTAADACEERYAATTAEGKSMMVEYLAAKSEGDPAFKAWVVAHGARYKELQAKGLAQRSELSDARDAVDEAERLQAARDAESRKAAVAAEVDSFAALMTFDLGAFEPIGAAHATDLEEITMPRASECTTKETLVTNADGTKSIQRTRVYTASDGTVTTKTDSKPLGGEYPSSDGDGDGDAAVAEMQGR